MTSLSAALIVPGTVVIFLLRGAVPSAQAPSLAEVAQREQERRKTTTATKILTNKDLPKVETPPVAAPVDPDASKSDAAAQPPSTNTAQTPREPAKEEAWWRARIGEPRERLHRN